MSQPSIVFLNGMGHVEVSWSPEHTERMRALVAKKLSEGVRFFIVKPKAWSLGLLKGTTEVTSADQIVDSVSVDDEDLTKLGVEASQIKVNDPELAELAAKGIVKFSRRKDGGEVETIGYARTPEEVMVHRTVATPPLRGG